MTILLNNVEFSYPNAPSKQVLNIDHWSIGQGERHFIYGASGSGKSTLLNLISGLLRSVSGSVRVLGESLDKMNSRQRDKFRANNIGYIFQQFNLITYLNSVENIALADYFSKTKSSSSLMNEIEKLLGALDIPQSDWHRPVNQLSVGQQQRIGIARAFINQPKLLIADEPTSSLDEPARDNFMSLLTSLCESYQATLLFVSHDTRLQGYFTSVQSLSSINRSLVKH